MAALDRMRAPLAALAIVPLALIGLTGCTTGSDGDETVTVEPTSEAGGEPGGEGGGGGGGGLPFPTFPGGDGGEGGGTGETGGTGGGTGGNGGSGGDGGTGGGGTGGGSGGGSGDRVAYGDHDLSGVDWEIVCTTGDSPSVMGGEAGAESDEDGGPVLWVSADERGAVDFVMLSAGGADSTSMIFWSSDSSSGSGSGTLTIADGRAVASGTAYEMMDYSYSNPLEYTVDVACGSTW